jgi:hypothetical protein
LSIPTTISHSQTIRQLQLPSLLAVNNSVLISSPSFSAYGIGQGGEEFVDCVVGGGCGCGRGNGSCIERGNFRGPKSFLFIN